MVPFHNTTVRLSKIPASLNRKIKLYIAKANYLESELFKDCNSWGVFQNDFNITLNDIFLEISDYEKECAETDRMDRLDKIKKLFIKRFRDLFLKGDLIKWSLEKPYGYAGDFQIIENIYENSPHTKGMNRLFDNYFLMSTISIAVRNRKEDFKRFLIDKIEKNKDLRIMNLACGSCREIRDLSNDKRYDFKRVIFDCYDHEPAALDFARNRFSPDLQINFIQENALKVALSTNIESRIEHSYDVIYSMGLFDYLNVKISTKLLSNLRKLLKPGGTIIIADVRDKYSNPSVHFMEWVGEWSLLYRGDQEFKEIFLNAGFDDICIQRVYEQQGLMQYILATKA